jgi:hypothetical protein
MKISTVAATAEQEFFSPRHHKEKKFAPIGGNSSAADCDLPAMMILSAAEDRREAWRGYPSGVDVAAMA